MKVELRTGSRRQTENIIVLEFQGKGRQVLYGRDRMGFQEEQAIKKVKEHVS